MRRHSIWVLLWTFIHFCAIKPTVGINKIACYLNIGFVCERQMNDQKYILIDINSLITDFGKLCTVHEFINCRTAKTQAHTYNNRIIHADVKWSFIEMNNLYVAVCVAQDLPCNDIG